MTVLECIQMALSRTGLSTTNTDFQTQARIYLNATLQQLAGEATWWWLHKTDSIQCTREFTLTSDTGTFTAESTVTGQTSAATATVASWAASTKVLTVKDESGTFSTSEVVQQSGSIYGTLSSIAATKTYSLASDVAYALSFRNKTQDYVMQIQGSESLDLRDPDQDQTGEPNSVTMIGLDATTGYQKVQLHPGPDDSTTDIDYRYYAYLPDYTSDDDSVNLNVKVPAIVQPALYFGVARLYKQEKGDYEGATLEFMEYQQVVNRALNVNRQSDGNRRYRMNRLDEAVTFAFQPVEGSLS